MKRMVSWRDPGVQHPGRLGGGGRELEAAASAAKPGDPPPELLPNGNALRSYWRDGREAKTPVRVK